MIADVFPLFSTPLYKTTLNYDLQKILKYVEGIEFEWLEEVKNGYRSKDVYILESFILFDLKKEIQSNINFFVYDILGVNKNIIFEVTNSWIMKHEKGNCAQDHYHDNCLISGIYYFQINDKSGEIVFKKNSEHLNVFPSILNIPFETTNNYNVKDFQLTPNNNDLILFPSHLIHSVGVNESDENRYCLAFNCFIKGTLGTDAGFNKLELK